MKQRFIMLLMTVLMALGMTQVAMAEEVRRYEGFAEYRAYYHGQEYNYFETVNVDAVRIGDSLSGSFATSKGDLIEWQIEISEDSSEKSVFILINNKYSHDDYGNLNIREDGGVYLYTKCEYEYEGSETDLGLMYLTLQLYPGEIISTEPEVYQISTGLTGTAISDRGDYNLYIAGYFDKELIDGVHELALSEITSQTIAVVAHNNTNGVNRNMNQSTVEEMTVNVSGGVVASMTIRGRVQTNGGTLDRYTATINP